MKEYLSPETVIVELHANRPVLQSGSWEKFEKFEEDPITNHDEILTKGALTGSDLWDQEW